jgi:NAD(P)-dependent dehydrogenase (short-subunit alcohol dehydrogenase family)
VLLENKVAVVYGAGGLVGGAVARGFAREGARIFLAGRGLEPLRQVVADIEKAGGLAEAAVVDALDEAAVDRFVDEVVAKAGAIDVTFNAISHGDVHGVPLLEMAYEDFARPITTAMRTQFLTARAAARHMVAQGSGVIMAITATTARQSIPNVGGTGVTFDAIESLCRQWACELGPRGVRVLWLQTTGIPEAVHADVAPDYGTGTSMTRDEHVEWMRAKTMMRRLTSLADVADMAAFIASDLAAAVTGSVVNMTYGAAPSR